LEVNLVKPGTATVRVFIKNVRRAQVLVDFFDEHTEGRQQPTKAAAELLRSALVFAVGALDTYLHDLILEIVPGRAPHSPRLAEELKGIAKRDPTLAFRLTRIDDDIARRLAFREALDKSLGTETFLNPRKLDQVLEFVGCQIDWQDFDEAAKCDAERELSLIAKQRNEILHRGSMSVITRDETGAAIALVDTLGRLIDDRVCKKYGIPSMTT
jgi:RiboL-PSP-HEPN